MVERVRVWDVEGGSAITCTLAALRERGLEPCSSCHYAVRDLLQHVGEKHSHAPKVGVYR